MGFLLFQMPSRKHLAFPAPSQAGPNSTSPALRESPRRVTFSCPSESLRFLQREQVSVTIPVAVRVVTAG